MIQMSDLPEAIYVDEDWNGRNIKMATYPDSHGYTGFSITELEVRFFVFGSLLKKTETGNANEIFSKWKPVMDDIIEKIEMFMKEDYRRGIHIDEVVDDSIMKRL